MEHDFIATAQLTAVKSSGERTPLELRIGKPTPNPNGGWSCSVAVGELFPSPPPLLGEDSLQSLCLAIAVGASLLREFVASGGRLEDEEGGEFPLEAYFGWFGELERPA